MFPQEIDSFIELYDLPANLVTQAKRYQELKMKPTLTSTEQNELNGLTTQLVNYIITPETWNKFADSLVNVETFFTQEVMGFIEAKQALWDLYVKAFKYVEIYNPEHAYKFQNMVKSNNGDLYLALQDVPAGNLLEDTAYWQKISTKGDKGDVGLNAYYKGDFDEAKTYVVGDAVTYEGFIYYCKKDTATGVLPNDSDHWFLWDRNIVSKTAPSTRQAGLVWIKLTD